MFLSSFPNPGDAKNAGLAPKQNRKNTVLDTKSYKNREKQVLRGFLSTCKLYKSVLEQGVSRRRERSGLQVAPSDMFSSNKHHANIELDRRAKTSRP